MNSKLRILLADDSRFFRAIESQFLQKTPVSILEASSCEETLSIARSEKPDLIYMAYTLRNDGGPACCHTLKNDPLLSSIPVVMICDKDVPEQVKVAERNGCDAWLVKPLDRNSFLQVGRKFISGIREHRQPSFFPITFTVDGEEFAGKCLDISGGGMFVESQADLPSGTKISLSFKLPGDLTTEVSCTAMISWLNRKPKPMKPHYPHGLGIMFLELPATIHKAILRHTEKAINR